MSHRDDPYDRMHDAFYDALEDRDIAREMERLEAEGRLPDPSEYPKRRVTLAGAIGYGLFFGFIGLFIAIFLIKYFD
ncbi:hypothetical protein [Nonomuraea sp. NEAU-A123]|uniref:hypothetical protein n=1 Tax=Nonomuraea sp. NEAU-A123 TaxID=2839649 RepID=UPI001BE433BA|nr:hypothetical protein [Nonomuraea sp. NEAU-A123]MBT2232529.1 hypothetical protein [Nonomuraea sp. NEAU-A123]